MKLPVVAVVGRPNVGKSAFFNRILGHRIAIVEDRPGVTRDRNFARTEWNGRQFYIVDTGGMVEGSDEEMDRLIRKQVVAAIEEADVVVQMVDGKAGPHPLDYQIADHLRRTERPTVLVVNKIDNLGAPNALGHHDFWDLGLGEPRPVGSLNGKGSGDVLDAIVEQLPESGDEEEAAAIRVAVIGKPNVGKSSLVNRLLGEDRLVVSEVAGTTRDSIDSPMQFHGRSLVFVDTAGLRRQARVDENVEFYSTLRTERAIERADVCLLLIDATEDIAVQDLRIAQKAWDAGCGLVLVANKWDLVPKETMTAPRYEKALRDRATFLQWVPIVFTSSLTGQRVHNTLAMILEVEEQRQRRIPTHEVNEVMGALTSRARPPAVQGRPIKFLYATQVAVAPPMFVLFVNMPDAVPESYRRYLHNGFRQAWSFMGVPLRINLRHRGED
ncbi:MAG: ribosome biogenesis GTPase Der [Gemmatimonadota bacterium]|nr:ribosome biogenesis GTPase Der [Gemmatimonadota bacterium]